MRLNKWALPGFFGLFYLLPLNFRNLWMPDESRYAEISREMLASGDWVVPHLLGLRYFEKPVAGYWFNNVSQLLFGHTNFAVRFACVFATALSAAIIFWLAMRLWRSHARAGAAALIYLSMLIVYGVGTFSVLDPIFTLWMTAAMACFCLVLDAATTRARLTAYAVFGICCGMGFLTKGFIALALPVVAIVPFMIYRQRFFELIVFGPIAVAAAAVVSAPWALAIQLRDPDYWHYFFWIENIKRFAGDNAQHTEPLWYFLPIIALGCLPWLGMMPTALNRAWRHRAAHPELVYLLLWALMPLIFFSLAKGKLLTYILPCFAPLALLAACALAETLRAKRTAPLRLNGIINGLFGLVGIGALWWFARAGDRPVYGPEDTAAWKLGLIAFAGWSFFGVLQCWQPRRGWALSALCPGLLALLFAWSLPQSIINSKQPGPFIAGHEADLSGSYALLANDVGLATSLAWALKRSDIKLFNTSGELAYGLSYPGVQDKRISRRGFTPWLENARRNGKIALLLEFDRKDSDIGQYLQEFPPGYRRFVKNELILLIYSPKKR